MRIAQMLFVGLLLLPIAIIAQEKIPASLRVVLREYSSITGKTVDVVEGVHAEFRYRSDHPLTKDEYVRVLEDLLREKNIGLFPIGSNRVVATWIDLSQVPASPSPAPRRLSSHQENRERREEILRRRLEELGMTIVQPTNSQVFSESAPDGTSSEKP
jgi:hypothetical protein